ncbi:MAG: hypothetical protein ABL871_03840 [Terricaulis sp.]
MPQSLSKPIRIGSAPLSAIGAAPQALAEVQRATADALEAQARYHERLAIKDAAIDKQVGVLDLAMRAPMKRKLREGAKKEELATLQSDLDAINSRVKKIAIAFADPPDKRQVIPFHALTRANAETSAAALIVRDMGPAELESFVSILLAEMRAANADPTNMQIAVGAAVLARISTMQDRPFSSAAFASAFPMPTLDASLDAMSKAKKEREKFQALFIDLSRSGEIGANTKMRTAIDGGALDRLDDGSQLPETI